MRTIDRTIIGNVGNGVLAVSPDVARALGIGGLSVRAGEVFSSSGRFLQNEPRLPRCKRDAKDLRGRVGVAPSADPGVP